MKVFLIGVGAAGNKAVLNAVDKGYINVEDTCIINSTSRDFPKEYEGKKIVLSDSDTGCGKERAAAKNLLKEAIKNKKLPEEGIYDYRAVVVVTSVEGGTGSGSAPTIAKFYKKCYNRNAHIIAFTGFDDDVRGLSNTVDFFKELSDEIMVQTISNKAYLQQAGDNKLKAEELANEEFGRRLTVLTGQDFIDGSQNIDDTDIQKLSNTPGYMTVEKKEFTKSLETVDDFNKIVKNMIYNSGSIKSLTPAAKRIGVILNLNEQSMDAVDYSFKLIEDEYGMPFERFQQVQWDGKKEYIAFVVSGMKMPLDEIKKVYDNYVEKSKNINKKNDEFFDTLAGMNSLAEDESFNMVSDVSDAKAVSVSSFLDDI